MATRKDTPKALASAQEIATECIGARVRMLSRLTTRVYDEHLRPLGLKFSQMNLLTVITARDPISPQQVGDILGLEKSTLSRNLRILESNGWIKTQSGETGNSLLLSPTAKGRRLVQKAEPCWRKAQDEVTSLLGESTTAAIRRGFDRVRDLGI